MINSGGEAHLRQGCLALSSDLGRAGEFLLAGAQACEQRQKAFATPDGAARLRQPACLTLS